MRDQYEALAKSPVLEGLPTDEARQALSDELLFQRASQVYLWALPLIRR